MFKPANSPSTSYPMKPMCETSWCRRPARCPASGSETSTATPSPVSSLLLRDRVAERPRLRFLDNLSSPVIQEAHLQLKNLPLLTPFPKGGNREHQALCTACHRVACHS